MYKPKSTKDIYVDSLSVNSANLEKQLSEQSVSYSEIKNIINAISKQYSEDVEGIVEECSKNMMALEHVPSPLKLFIDCLGRVYGSLDLSPQSRKLIQHYTAAWEDWM
jgi:hypothetical protein